MMLRSARNLLFLLMIGAGLLFSCSTVILAQSHSSALMGQSGGPFIIYDDSARNNFYSYAKVPDQYAAVTADGSWSQMPHRGTACIRFTFKSTGNNWGGWYILYDPDPGAAVQTLNFGTVPNAGVDLSGATRLTFWARGKVGGEKIDFFMGGIGRNPHSGIAIAPYPDSTPRVPDAGTTITLTTTWTKYTIDLRGRDLRYVVAGFGWLASANDNPNSAEFYVDDIQYDPGSTGGNTEAVRHNTVPGSSQGMPAEPEANTGSLDDSGTSSSMLPTPQGFTVVSGSGQAYLDWFPTLGASGYNIVRRRADVGGYKTIASNVPMTYFMDTGLKPGKSYYYAVSADISGQVSPISDEVLATPVAGTILMADSLDDWSNTVSHTPNLQVEVGDGDVQMANRSAGGAGSFVYRVPGVRSFAVDVMWDNGDMSRQLSIDVSADGSTWTAVPIIPELQPIHTHSGWLGAIAVPDGSLPAGASYLRVNLGTPSDTSCVSPKVSDVRITFGDSDPQTPSATPAAATAPSPTGIPAPGP